MSENSSYLIIDRPCDAAIAWVDQQLASAGLKVMRTFDLSVARHDPASCPCPHHGTEDCDCQMVVLLVYNRQPLPVSLVAHGYNGQTWLSVINTPQQRANPEVEAAIRHALTPHSAATLVVLNPTHTA